jgi:RNA-directed DNA polymerase
MEGIRPRRTGNSLQETLKNRHNRKKQMTGQPDALRHKSVRWSLLNWGRIEANVRRLQIRIAKAVTEGKWRKAKLLQYLLTHSFEAKLLAVRRVTRNKGARTAGVDNVLWKTNKQKVLAARRLRQHGYKAKALRRIYIKKKDGRNRPLSIPTMHDRAMQALYALALVPIAEATADPNSYGFREGRSCHDAIAQCFMALAKPHSAEWVLEADIKGCYDNIDKEWIIEHIPMDKRMLRQWLEAGYIEEDSWFQTEAGCPQGGIISPVLANMTLDGLQKIVKESVPKKGSRVNFIRYADDFIVTAKDKDLLTQKIIPAITAFLSERGLVLSAEKSKITSIYAGFDFLGQNIRKYKKKLLIKPSKKATASMLDKVRMIIHKHRGRSADKMVNQLCSIIRGWAIYHRHSVCSVAFRRVDWTINNSLMKWAQRTHPKKSTGWILKKYFYSPVSPTAGFYARSKNKKRETVIYHLYLASNCKGLRYIKVRANTNPYMKEHTEYFASRKQTKNRIYGKMGLPETQTQSIFDLKYE